MYDTQYPSPIGMLLLSCTDDGLTGISINQEPPQEMQDHSILQQAKIWLDAYFQGKNPPVEIPLAPEGTAFQKQVWEILLTIPYGKTTTYGQIARQMAARLGKEKMSAQAVGQAVGRNPICILVPCHRVVGSAQQLTGYRYGLDKKICLLQQEGHQIEDNTVL